MIHFILGAMFGGVVGVVGMCFCVAAGKADSQMDDE